MIRRILLSTLASGAMLGALGCRHKCCSNNLDRDPKPFLPPGPGGSVIGPPMPPGSTIPPANLPTTPPSVLPPVGPSGSSPIPPPNKEVLLPDPLPGGPSSRSNSIIGGPVKPAAGQTTEPPLAAAPTGLPGFTKIKDGVAAGGKPALEGFDSLKQAGYRTVVYLHPAGADVGKAKDVAESRGLAFVAIETTPEKLAAAAEQFNRAIGERATKPVYVYGDDPLRAGAVWYLHFRTVDLHSPEVAKIRARGLGLSDTGDEAKAFWVAIQQYLAR